MNILTQWAYRKVAQHQKYTERVARRSVNYSSYIAKVNLFDPILDILPDGPRFWEWAIQIGRGNKITLHNQFLLVEPFANYFTDWNAFTATLSITKSGDMTLDEIRFKPTLSEWLADNETQLWTLMLDALYTPDQSD